jgi:hypothetical protein
MTAVFFERYYADDAALRLYSAGEQLASAVKYMLEVADAKLRGRKEVRGSRLLAVTKHLESERPDHKVTRALLSLKVSGVWKSTVAYRNEWVHDQPPTVAGLGIVHHRRRRWQFLKDGKPGYLTVGGGDEPKHTTDNLIGLLEPAFEQFILAATVCVEYYEGMLTDRGITKGSGG